MNGIMIEYRCQKCEATFLTKNGIDTHDKKMHGTYCETCPIDLAVNKITSLFKRRKSS